MTETTNSKLATEIGALLRARASLIWIQTNEEMRVKLALAAAIEDATNETQVKHKIRQWNAVDGVRDIEGRETVPGKEAADPSALLNYIAVAVADSRLFKSVWLLCDFPWALKDPLVLRAMRNLALELPKAKLESAQTVIIISPSAEIPPELSDHAVLLKWPLPDQAEISAILDAVLIALPANARETAFVGTREAAIEAAVGLSATMAQSCYKRSLVTQQRKIVPAIVAAEKKRVINREKGIEWTDPDPRGLAAVGGLDNLKAWLTLRRSAFSEKARAFGLIPPKGVLIVGPPGGGKSLTAKAIAAAWGVPLLKMDLGGMKSKFVGESEAAIRSSLAVVDAVGNCVVWLDEIEKSLTNASGALDGGVSSDALGVLLTWMQEKQGGAFVVATANDVSALPPELLRKGRFDEIFAVDLPTQLERAAILAVALKAAGRELPVEDIEKVATACVGMVGAEIASIVPAALFVCFSEDARPLQASDLLREAGTIVPLAKTASEKITALREWAKNRARAASLPEEPAASSTTGDGGLDFGN